MGEEGLVVELSEKDIDVNSNHIELHEIEDDIRNSKVVWVYLQGVLFPFMECIEVFYKHVSIKFVDSWNKRRVTMLA